MSPPQSRRGSSRTAPPDRSSQADRPSRKSPQAACPHQKNRIDPSYPHPRILLCGLDSHKFRKGRYFSRCPIEQSSACSSRYVGVKSYLEGVMSLSLADKQTLNSLSDLFYSFLPASFNNNTSFPIAAQRA